ncbi:uncharacterized protein O3C94_018922 [Discoglossus pictus]
MIVGIFSRDGQESYQWLIDQLTSPFFKPIVKDVRPVYISNNSAQNFRNEVPKCSFAILYHTKRRGRVNVTDVTDSLYDHELSYLSSVLGRQKVVVVVDDLDNSGPNEKNNILRNQPSIKNLACELFLFSESEKSLLPNGNYQSQEGKIHELKRIISSAAGYHTGCRFWPILLITVVLIIVLIIVLVFVKKSSTHNGVTNSNITSNESHNISLFLRALNTATKRQWGRVRNTQLSPIRSQFKSFLRIQINRKMVSSKKVVGIFSREGEDSYNWLTNYLLTLPGVDDVRHVYISNDSSQMFREEVYKCSFAILYHSKRRGRVNVTDVTDSLYDYELEHLNSVKGRDKVLVVIDDLDNSDPDEKNRILQNQPSIEKLAQGVILFSKKEKECLNSNGSVMERQGYQSEDPARSMSNKLEEIRHTIRGKKGSYERFEDSDGLSSSYGGTFWQRNRDWLLPLSIFCVVLIVVGIIIGITTHKLHHGNSTVGFTTPQPGKATSTGTTVTSKAVTSTTSSKNSTASTKHVTSSTEHTTASTKHVTSSKVTNTSSNLNISSTTKSSTASPYKAYH